MFQNIVFQTPAVIFGIDALKQIGQQAAKLGAGSVLLITGPQVKKAGLLEKTESFLKTEGISVKVNIQDRDTPEPATDVVEATAEIARKGDFDVIIGLGGGSILDVAKMASALCTNPGKTEDYFGRERVPKRGKPTIIVPTTAGTGAEVTKHAIFLDRAINVKKVVASSNLLPNVAIVDPALTLTCPPAVTASAGIDAFIHSAEAYLSKNANTMTDALALESISIITKWLGPAFADGQGMDARYHMSLESLMAGVVLNNSGTSLVHAMAYPVGGEHHTPHGVTLSALLIACFEYVAVAKAEKMAALARAMGENIDGLAPRDVVDRVLDAIHYLIRSVDLPASLTDLGISREKTDIHQWAVEAHKEQRLLTRSPRILSVEDIEKIYENAFE
ncbi:MAG: iron-containing alcohol dehydrogenase [Proteobacteria bacterium]|nr:iron-containing alcohol dehydrogenase [Pseudomonadota bacterium]MBU2227837.1 iron-containing alcohol dehydrogenase [Pseudomonadota bacterium]MBU2260530.1 iron-containing alcohol dehydrogenase [Pseudomonadota bacterium]